MREGVFFVSAMNPRSATLFRRLLLAAAIAAALAGCAVLDSRQRQWIFQPVREDWRGYAGTPHGTDEFWLDVATGAVGRARAEGQDAIHAWWMAHENPAAPVILYLHGSRWNLTGSSYRIERWRAMGFTVLAIDYRGFGKSSGDLPSEAMTYVDARVAWNWLKAAVPDPGRRFIYGHSLGGAVAIDLAAALPAGEAAGLITEATFTSIADIVASSQWGFLPVGPLLTQRFESMDKVARITLPKLFIHGTGDRIVPHPMSDRLFAAAAEPKQLLKVEGGGHSNIAWSGFEGYRQAIGEFVRTAQARLQNTHATR